MFLLCVILLGHVSQHALGEEVTEWVYEGQKSVSLPCTIPGGFGDITSVVWSRFDLDPAIIQQHGTEDPNPNVQYSGRTSLSADFIGFFYRDLTLTIDKPRISDSGTYTCTVHSTKHGILRKNVDLQVTKPYTVLIKVWVVLSLLFVVAGAVVVAVGLAVFLWEKTISVSQVEVMEGEWLVELPYKTMVKLPEDVTVEWSRCAPEPMRVHVYQNHVVSHDQMYSGRTSMKADWLKTRNLSLTLRDPCFRDSGTYICSVHRNRQILVQRAVRLQVTVPVEIVEIGDGSKTFMLPFVTSAQLPEDATVEWKRSEPTNMTVHVFENGQDQPYRQDQCYQGKTRMNSDPLRSKDLSVTISNSGRGDSGTYICTVRREGYILAQKTVLHRVKGLTEMDVEAEYMSKTVKLPWFIVAQLPEDASVEWSIMKVGVHIYTKKVHVYQDGQDQPDQQDHYYQGRTTMTKNPLQTGDLSLTLKNPTVLDNGAYVCAVKVNGKSVWERMVRLKVKGQYCL
ncbi:uncharacterized protein LOC117805730 [Xyrichtys novacula]|nr:uncharacterized protein LOC117805730 [Xyrichtys novacula]